jgi:hypothetical protein
VGHEPFDLEVHRCALEGLAALAVEREQLDRVMRWMAEVAERVLRVDGEDHDR